MVVAATVLFGLGAGVANAAFTTTTIPVGTQPFGIAFNPATNSYYVANNTDGTVSRIDGATNTVTATITVGGNPNAVTLNPSTNMIYVSKATSGTVVVIDGATNTVTATIPLSGAPADIAYNPTNNTVYVANGGDGNGSTVFAIDAATNTVVAAIAVGAGPYGVAVDPSTNTVYATNWAGGAGSTMSVISGATNTVTQTISVGSGPLALAVNPATHAVYVVHQPGSTVTVIDGLTNTVTATISFGGNPRQVGVDSSTNTIFVSVNTGNVAVIDGATNTITQTLPVNSSPAYFAVNPANHCAYVTDFGGASVSVLCAVPDTATTTTLTPANTSDLVVGQPVTFTATVSPQVNGGTVDFFRDGALVCGGVPLTGDPNAATCQMTFTTPGRHNVQARYNGVPGSFAGSVSTNTTYNVVATTTTTLAPANTTDLVVGQPVTFTATVSPRVTGGTVDFFRDGGLVCGGVPVIGNPNAATCQMTFATPGSHNVQARYNGVPGSFAGSVSTNTTYNVVVAGTKPTTTTVVCSPLSVRVGQASTCKATVTDALHPTGNVNFASNASGTFYPGSCTLVLLGGSQAGCTVTYTPKVVQAGSHKIYANYSGSSTNAPSHNSTTITVTPGASSTSVSCAPSTVAVGSASTCTATVSGVAGTASPTGQVTFASNPAGSFNSTVCTLVAAGGSASCSVKYTPTKVGSHAIYASYPGDPNHTASHATTTITVTP